jgi:hypothetical protein
MKRLASLLLAAFLLASAPAASAASSENAMQEITKSLFYGGVAGLAVGGVILVANNGDNAGGILKWSFVTGAFIGLGYGLYEVSSGRDSYGLIDIEEGRLRLRAVLPEPAPDGARMTLVAAHF